MKSLREEIGAAELDHFAILVQYGMMRAAVSFFIDQLGWQEDKAARTAGDWGEARFVKPEQSSELRVQLTELADVSLEDELLPAVHLGLRVTDPHWALDRMFDWASYCGIDAEGEEIPGGKCFVSFPNIFAVRFELVPVLAD